MPIEIKVLLLFLIIAIIYFELKKWKGKMTDQTKHGIDFVQSSNKARMYERKKAEQKQVYENSNLGSEVKDRMLKFIDDNSHNKTMGEMQSMLSSAVSDFYKGGN